MLIPRQHADLWVLSPTNVCEHMICKYVDGKGPGAMLATKKSAGVAPEVNPLHTGNEACERRIHPGLKTQGETSTKVKNSGISGPTKRTYVPQNFLKKNKPLTPSPKNGYKIVFINKYEKWNNRLVPNPLFYLKMLKSHGHSQKQECTLSNCRTSEVSEKL